MPPGTVAIPPPLDGLKPAPSLKAELARKVARGTDTPTSAVNAAAADLPSGATPNSSFVPPTKVVARVAKSLRRAERGGTLPDPVRLDLLVRSHLVQRQMVLLYEPGQMLVLSSPALLEMACGAKMVSSDAKIDTVAGVQSKWSSIRGKTLCGLSAPFAVWIGPEENQETIRQGAVALAVNVRCSRSSCDHALRITYGGDGSIRMHRRCWEQPDGTIVSVA